MYTRYFWLTSIVVAFWLCIYLGLAAWDQYLNKSVVLSIQRDHYSWNVSLPALTICPNGERISRSKFSRYARLNGLSRSEQDEMYDFFNSLANSTYINFKEIKSTNSTDVSVYMCVLYVRFSK